MIICKCVVCCFYKSENWIAIPLQSLWNQADLAHALPTMQLNSLNSTDLGVLCY